MVTYVPNKSEPIFNWFRFKEAFSKQLVELILREFSFPARAKILDPFAGCGTTLLAARDAGHVGVGIDILPIAVFVTRAKLEDDYDLSRLEKIVSEVIEQEPQDLGISLPDVPIVHKALPAKTQRDLVFFREFAKRYRSPYRGFLHLALISILEEVSYSSKDGQFLRLVKKYLPPVHTAYKRRLLNMLSELQRRQERLFPDAQKAGRVEIFLADARDTSLPPKYRGKINAVITSPPYLNRYDYSRTYSLELCLLSVKDFGELRSIRHSLLRSHIESKEHQGKEIDFPAVSEILGNLAERQLNNERIPIMIRGYFEDMNLVIQNLARWLAPGGRVALVVANARFEGVHVPVDLMLCELASQALAFLSRLTGRPGAEGPASRYEGIGVHVCSWAKGRASAKHQATLAEVRRRIPKLLSPSSLVGLLLANYRLRFGELHEAPQ